jgi:hypothetical protein
VAAVPGVGAVPGAAPVQLPGPSSIADSVVGGPMPPPTAAPISVTPPAAPPAVPSIANGVVGDVVQRVAQLPPQERQRLVGQIAQGFIEGGGSLPGQFGEFMLGVGGSQNALAPAGQEPYSRTQLSALQTGAKVGASNTLTGFDADQQRQVDKAKMEDATRRRGDDLRHSASIYASNQATARAGKRGGGKGAGKDDMVQNKRVKDFFMASGGAKDDPNRQVVSNEQADAMMDRYRELMDTGDYSAAEAANAVVDEAWQTVNIPAKKGKHFWNDDEPERSETRFALKSRPRITEEELNSRRAGDTPAAPAAPPGGKGKPGAAPAAPVVPKLKNGGVDVETLRSQANASIAAGKDPKWIRDKFKATTGKDL